MCGTGLLKTVDRWLADSGLKRRWRQGATAISTMETVEDGEGFEEGALAAADSDTSDDGNGGGGVQTSRGAPRGAAHELDDGSDDGSDEEGRIKGRAGRPAGAVDASKVDLD